MMVMNHLELQVIDFDAWSLLCWLPTYLNTYTCTAWTSIGGVTPGQLAAAARSSFGDGGHIYDKKTTVMQKLRKHFGWRLSFLKFERWRMTRSHLPLRFRKRKVGDLERKEAAFGHHQPTVFTPIDAMKFKVQHLRTGGQGLTQIPTFFRTLWSPDSVRPSGTLYGHIFCKDLRLVNMLCNLLTMLCS
jgi:hypothetical protein